MHSAAQCMRVTSKFGESVLLTESSLYSLQSNQLLFGMNELVRKISFSSAVALCPVLNPSSFFQMLIGFFLDKTAARFRDRQKYKTAQKIADMNTCLERDLNPRSQYLNGPSPNTPYVRLHRQCA
jgi:hypothetical protein